MASTSSSRCLALDLTPNTLDGGTLKPPSRRVNGERQAQARLVNDDGGMRISQAVCKRINQAWRHDTDPDRLSRPFAGEMAGLTENLTGLTSNSWGDELLARQHITCGALEVIGCHVWDFAEAC